MVEVRRNWIVFGRTLGSLMSSSIRMGISRWVERSSIRFARSCSVSIFWTIGVCATFRICWPFNQSRPPCRPSCTAAATMIAAALPTKTRQRRRLRARSRNRVASSVLSRTSIASICRRSNCETWPPTPNFRSLSPIRERVSTGADTSTGAGKSLSSATSPARAAARSAIPASAATARVRTTAGTRSRPSQPMAVTKSGPLISSAAGSFGARPRQAAKVGNTASAFAQASASSTVNRRR